MIRSLRQPAVLLSIAMAVAAAGCASTAPSPAPVGVDSPPDDGSLPYVDPVDQVPSATSADEELAALEQAAETPRPQVESESAGPAAVSGEAVMRPGLTVSVRVSVAAQDEVNQRGIRISERGTLTLPLVGEVMVDGLTLVECEQRLVAHYQEYLVNPQVSVQFEWTQGSMSPWGAVTVLGRVASPGKVPIPATRDLTVSAAIQQAGGFDTSARDSAIVVSRRNPDGTTRRMEVDLRALGRRGNLQEDIVLQSGDVVFVPEEIF